MRPVLNYITILNKGTFVGETEFPTSPEDIDNLFNHLSQNNITKIGIFIHGGLVPEEAGMEAVKNMQAEVFDQTGTYGIGLVWKSGFMDALKQNMSSVHKTKLFKKILIKILKKAGGKLGFGVLGKGLGEMSDEDILAELEKETPFLELESGEKAVGLVGENVDYDLLERELIAAFERDVMQDSELRELQRNKDENFWLQTPSETDLQETKAKGFPWLAIAKPLVKITIQMIKRKLKGHWHGFHATAIEEILRQLMIADFAEDIWGAMKNKAEWMWKDHEGTGLDEMYVGTYFLEKLQEYAQERELELHLIAHSAGAVVTCHMIKRIVEKQFPLRFKNILFLAPACTMELFHEAYLPNAGIADRFRMFTMKDIHESDDKLVDNLRLNLYPSSLLYFVSGVCEPKVDQPILGMERYYSRRKPYNKTSLTEVADYIEKQHEDRVAWSITDEGAPSGLQSASKDHGYFDNEPQTLESLRTLLA